MTDIDAVLEHIVELVKTDEVLHMAVVNLLEARAKYDYERAELLRVKREHMAQQERL